MVVLDVFAGGEVERVDLTVVHVEGGGAGVVLKDVFKAVALVGVEVDDKDLVVRIAVPEEGGGEVDIGKKTKA